MTLPGLLISSSMFEAVTRKAATTKCRIQSPSLQGNSAISSLIRAVPALSISTHRKTWKVPTNSWPNFSPNPAASLFDGEPSRNVVLPRGEWHDFWSGQPVSGGRTIEVGASFQKIPVFVKTGSVLPMGGIANSTADPETRNLTVRIFGDGSLPFAIAGKKKPELLLQWKNGRGTIEQGETQSRYRVMSWVPATDPFQ
jgi:Glycosyl hydrolase family 31 C-terminal domain